MRIKSLIIICLAIMLSHQAAFCEEEDIFKYMTTVFKRPAKGHYLWPIALGSVSLTGSGIDDSDSTKSSGGVGYAFSGGATFSVYREKLFLLVDALYSIRSYGGSPKDIHYQINESTTDLAIAGGWEYTYIGACVQFPMNTQITVDEWTLDDFGDISRRPSVSLILGGRATSKHFGVDLRFSLGEGPANYLKKSLDDSFQFGLALGFMGGF